MAATDPFARRPLLFGVVHCPPLPGSPAWTRSRREGGRGRPDAWLRRVLADTVTYLEAGFEGLIVENYGDAPFFAGRVPAETAAALAVAARAVREAFPAGRPVGVNVLRNDGRTAIAVAAAAGLDFIRVNVLSGAFVTDQGLVEGEAAAILRDRERLAPRVRILADVRVKHAAPLAGRPITEEALDLVERGGADAIVVTGPRTGRPVDLTELETVRRAVPETTLLVGSGATRSTVGALLTSADGVIVGTAVKRGGRTQGPVDPRRAASFAASVRR